MATKAMAAWALALQFSQIPDPIINLSVKSVYNWAGCAIGGYAQPSAGIAYEAMTPFLGNNGSSTILGTDQLVDAQTAALINGIASHADDYDDTHRDNPIHPSGPVLSALLAVSGRDFITAFIAGVEAECKLGVSVFPEHYNVGWRKSKLSMPGRLLLDLKPERLMVFARHHKHSRIGRCCSRCW
jgi:aconitate decarboxylase